VTAVNLRARVKHLTFGLCTINDTVNVVKVGSAWRRLWERASYRANASGRLSSL
jgi:hypothetical protein